MYTSGHFDVAKKDIFLVYLKVMKSAQKKIKISSLDQKSHPILFKIGFSEKPKMIKAYISQGIRQYKVAWKRLVSFFPLEVQEKDEHPFGKLEKPHYHERSQHTDSDAQRTPRVLRSAYHLQGRGVYFRLDR